MSDEAVTDDVRSKLEGESDRIRSQLEARLAQIEDRLTRMERTGRIALTEIRSLATKVDRVSTYRRIAE